MGEGYFKSLSWSPEAAAFDLNLASETRALDLGHATKFC